MGARSAMIGSPEIFLPRMIGSVASCPNCSLVMSSRKETPSRWALGSSMPMTVRPGMVATRADRADMLRAMSSASAITRLALMPGAGSSSYMVTTGPGFTSTIWPFTWKSSSTLSSSRALRSSAALSILPPCAAGTGASRSGEGSEPWPNRSSCDTGAIARWAGAGLGVWMVIGGLGSFDTVLRGVAARGAGRGSSSSSSSSSAAPPAKAKLGRGRLRRGRVGRFKCSSGFSSARLRYQAKPPAISASTISRPLIQPRPPSGAAAVRLNIPRAVARPIIPPQPDGRPTSGSGWNSDRAMPIRTMPSRHLPTCPFHPAMS